MELQLKRLRKASGLTQEQLGDRLSTTKRVIGAYERGETPIPLDVACEIAIILNCTLNALVGLPDPECQYLDPQQAKINEYYENSNSEGKKQIFQAAKNAFSNVENRILKDGQILRGAAMGA